MENNINVNDEGWINFSDIIGSEIEEKENICKYALKNQKEYLEDIDLSSQFIDPSYDPVFKKLFSDGYSFNSKKGIDRLRDLLNSIIFPNSNDKIFVNITYNSNESNKFDIES